MEFQTGFRNCTEEGNLGNSYALIEYTFYCMVSYLCSSTPDWFISVMYEGDSKSKGKIHLTAVIQVTVSNFTYYFST